MVHTACITLRTYNFGLKLVRYAICTVPLYESSQKSSYIKIMAVKDLCRYDTFCQNNKVTYEDIEQKALHPTASAIETIVKQSTFLALLVSVYKRSGCQVTCTVLQHASTIRNTGVVH